MRDATVISQYVTYQFYISSLDLKDPSLHLNVFSKRTAGFITSRVVLNTIEQTSTKTGVVTTISFHILHAVFIAHSI